MFMKKSEMINLFQFLNQLKLNKIKNSEVRSALLKMHMAMYKAVNQINEDVAEMRKKIFDGRENDLLVYNTLNAQIKTTTDVDKVNELMSQMPEGIVDLVSDFSTQYTDFLNANADIKISPAPTEAFVDALIDQEIEFSLADIAEFTRLNIIK